MLSLRIELPEQQVETARLMTQATVLLSANRNRIFESLLAQQAFCDALWDYMEEQDLDLKTYQIDKEQNFSDAEWRREIFDISDVCVNGWRVEIRRIRPGSEFFYISKTLADSFAKPDIYAVMALTLAQKVADAELIGWLSRETLEELSSETIRDEFYKISLEKLEAPLSLFEQLKQPVTATFHELQAESPHIAELAKTPSFLMRPLSNAESEARNHLFLCQECAVEYIAALQSRERTLQERPEYQPEKAHAPVIARKNVFSSDGFFAQLLGSLDARRLLEAFFLQRAGLAFASEKAPEVMVLDVEDTEQDVSCRKGKLMVEERKGILSLRIGLLPVALAERKFMMFIIEKEVLGKIANVLGLTDQEEALRKAFSRQSLDKNFEIAHIISRLPALEGQVSKYREIRISEKVSPTELPLGTIIVVLIG